MTVLFQFALDFCFKINQKSQEIWNTFEVCFQSYLFLAERVLRSCIISGHLFDSSLPICTWFLFQNWSGILGNMKQFWSVFSCFLVRRESVCRTLLTREQITFETHFKFVSLFLRFLQQKSSADWKRTIKKVTRCYTISQEGIRSARNG